jgi:hypothetical protein
MNLLPDDDLSKHGPNDGERKAGRFRTPCGCPRPPYTHPGESYPASEPLRVIRVDKIERSSGSKVRVKFDVQTSVGPLSIEKTVDDFGSAGENETQALLEVRKLLEEALDMVRNKLG